MKVKTTRNCGLFSNTIDHDNHKISIIAKEYLSGKKNPLEEPKNPGYIRLINPNLLNYKERVRESARSYSQVLHGQQPIFKQVPFWQNLNEQTDLCNEIDKSARKTNRNFDSIISDQEGYATQKNSLIEYRAGSIETRNLDVTYDTSRLGAFQQSKNDSNLHSLMIHKTETKSVTVAARTGRKGKRSLIEELNALHMYDSILLGKTQHEKESKILPSIKGHRRNRTATVSQALEDESNQSSAASRKNVLIFGAHEIETMRGHKISKLSPVTRKMN